MVHIERSDDVITAYLEGEIDHHSAKDIREEIDAEVEKIKPDLLIVDFRDVSFMDSSGIGLVMGRYKLINELGGKLLVTNMSNHIERVMKLSGITRLGVLDKKKS